MRPDGSKSSDPRRRQLSPNHESRSMSVPNFVIDLVMAFLILLMTYALSSEGLWGAALMFFNVVFGGLIAFNFYEPLARLIDSTGIGWGFSDTLSLLSIFCVSVLLLRMITETLAPAMVRFPSRSTTPAGSCSRWPRRWSPWRSWFWHFTPRRCTRRSSGPSTTSTNRHSAWVLITSGLASSSTPPETSSPAMDRARVTRLGSMGAAATSGLRCESSTHGRTGC